MNTPSRLVAVGACLLAFTVGFAPHAAAEVLTFSGGTVFRTDSGPLTVGGSCYWHSCGGYQYVEGDFVFVFEKNMAPGIGTVESGLGFDGDVADYGTNWFLLLSQSSADSFQLRRVDWQPFSLTYFDVIYNAAAAGSPSVTMWSALSAGAMSGLPASGSGDGVVGVWTDGSMAGVGPYFSDVPYINFSLNYFSGLAVDNFYVDEPAPMRETTVPEPASFLTFAVGLLGLRMLMRRQA